MSAFCFVLFCLTSFGINL